MSRRKEIVKTIYENYCEDERLERTRHGTAIPMLHTSGRIVDVKEVGDKWLVEAEISNYTDLDLWLSTDSANPDRPWDIVTAIGTKAYKSEEKVDLFDTALCDSSGASLVPYMKIIRGTKKQPVYFLIKGQGLGKYDINGCYVSILTIGLLFFIILDRFSCKFYWPSLQSSASIIS